MGSFWGWVCAVCAVITGINIANLYKGEGEWSLVIVFGLLTLFTLAADIRSVGRRRKDADSDERTKSS